MKKYTDINAAAVDNWVKSGWEWGTAITAEDFAKAKDGCWDVVLTPLKPVPKQWFAPYLKNGRLDGAALLGLASGGGQQMPVFAALGADCTVLDYSAAQLETETAVATREGYEINTVRADMTLPLPFADNSFHIIFHPVSNCFVEDVYPIWRECYRVLKPGGILMAGMCNGVNYLFNEDENGHNDLKLANKLPYNPLKNPALMQKSIDNNWAIEFSHTLEEQIGGQLQAGLTLTHLFEDRDKGPISEYYPTFLATRATKQGGN
ncbi:MAG: class I SAM-dependent methyltransferase [Defluviitaleaceae bacterium]|nr:class I SAM-dependent methyltransferase [Defluviitaleaceae bacterium]